MTTAAAPASLASRPDKGAPARHAGLEAAFDACGLRDGAALSFHHHLRDGDAVLNAVLAIARRRGLRDLGVAASSVFPCHAPLAEAMREGIVTRLWTGYMKGAAADAVAAGVLPAPARLMSHGGRARAIESGALPIDAAFIAAPHADVSGALTGGRGAAACGPLGYAGPDARHARRVVAVAAEIGASAPTTGAEIPAGLVDHLVEVPSIGDPARIASGATRIATDPAALRIAGLAAAAVEASGEMRQGMSLQTGAGGASLAAAALIGERMRAAGIRGGFLSGGIASPHVALVRAGIFTEIRNVQCFDRESAASFRDDPWHHGMCAAEYASPLHPDPVCDRLSVVILGAAEVDRDFNVNVTVSGEGRIIGGPGGHPDTAEGARLTVIVTRLSAGGWPKIVPRVGAVTTPGAHVDLVVTERGLAVNPRHGALDARLRGAGLPVLPIDTMIRLAEAESGRSPMRPAPDAPVVALIEDRHGAVRGRLRRMA